MAVFPCAGRATRTAEAMAVADALAQPLHRVHLIRPKLDHAAACRTIQLALQRLHLPHERAVLIQQIVAQSFQVG